MANKLTKHTMNLRAGDFDRLQVLYPNSGASKVIRELVSRALDTIERQADAEIAAPDIGDK